MSGRKRALLRMNERDRKKLANIEARLGTVDIDFASLQTRIEEFKNIISEKIDMKQEQRDEIFINRISHLDRRIQQIEEATQEALHEQASQVNTLLNTSSDQITNFENRFELQFESVLDYLNQINSQQIDQINNINDEFEEIFRQSQNHQNIAWQNLNYAQEIFKNLYEIDTDNELSANEYRQIEFLLSSGWFYYQNESYQAAMVSAQQAVVKGTELRFKIEERFFKNETTRLLALEETTRILDLAINSQQVKAIDLNGNLLDIDVDVNFWTEGSVEQAIQTLSSIQTQLIDQNLDVNITSLEELIGQTLPSWENALHNYVANARIEIIASQTRFEVANTVVGALAEQGFEVQTGSFEAGDQRLSYHVVLGNLEGSQVHISISPDNQDPMNYLLDIDSYDSDIRSETELRNRTKELLGSVEAAGINIGQVYQAVQPDIHKVRDSNSIFYSIRSNETRKKHNPND